MSIAKNDIKVEQQLDQLTLTDNSKYLEEQLDDALVTAMKGDQKNFCLKTESFLNDFMKSSKTVDKILNLDKFQRKIVHKICDMYAIKREYVDVRPDDKGDITLSKNEQSKLPERGLEVSYKKLFEDKTKSTQKVVQVITGSSNPQKILIKKKSDNTSTTTHPGPPVGFTIAKKEPKKEIIVEKKLKEQTAEEKLAEDEAKDDIELEKKKMDYEIAKNRIFEGISEGTTDPSQKPQSKKKALNANECYDPAFDRAKGAASLKKPESNVVDSNMGMYPVMFPQLGGGPMIMNMNPYANYQPMNPYPPMMMNPYPIGSPGNMVNGFPYQGGQVMYPQNNLIMNPNLRPNLPPQKKSSKEL
jgi:hypothetical protein